MKRDYTLDLVNVSEATARAAATLKGRGDEPGVDALAQSAMAEALEELNIAGRVAFSIGVRDSESPLYAGAKIGGANSEDRNLEFALAPLEGTIQAAAGGSNAVTALALASAGSILKVPKVKMDKLACGPEGRGLLSLEKTPLENLQILAEAKGVAIDELTVVILDRPRHDRLVESVREAGARIALMPDGDLIAAIATCFSDTGLDLLLGVGNAGQGVMAAIALKCLGGDFQGRLQPRGREDQEAMDAYGISDSEKVYTLDDIVAGDCAFAATGITEGFLLNGVRFSMGRAHTHSLSAASQNGIVRTMTSTFPALHELADA